ncbi:hypothetical protein BJV78DRAFT_1219450, partial [Lactifluus subvellereus]
MTEVNLAGIFSTQRPSPQHRLHPSPCWLYHVHRKGRSPSVIEGDGQSQVPTSALSRAVMVAAAASQPRTAQCICRSSGVVACAHSLYMRWAVSPCNSLACLAYILDARVTAEGKTRMGIGIDLAKPRKQVCHRQGCYSSCGGTHVVFLALG